jgi:uncharacterized protein (DUF433 family)
MTDDKSLVGTSDINQNDGDDSNEIEYVLRQFPHLTHQQVSDAIKRIGPLRKDVIEYLKNKQ